MNYDISIGSTVKLLWWRFNEIREGVIKDIFFEKYLTGYKTVVKVEFYMEKSNYWCLETYYVNDFFDAIKGARKNE